MKQLLIYVLPSAPQVKLCVVGQLQGLTHVPGMLYVAPCTGKMMGAVLLNDGTQTAGDWHLCMCVMCEHGWHGVCVYAFGCVCM